MSSLWYSSPDQFTFDTEDDSPINLTELKSSVQNGFQSQLNRDPSTLFHADTFAHLGYLFNDRDPTPVFSTNNTSSCPPQDVDMSYFPATIPSPPPAPQVRPPPPSSTDTAFNPSYHGAPTGLFPYGTTSVPAPLSTHYVPYLPEDSYQPSPFHSAPTVPAPRLGSYAVSHAPNPFVQANGLKKAIPIAPVQPAPPTARKLAAAARQRHPNGKFLPRSKVSDDPPAQDPNLVVTLPPSHFKLNPSFPIANTPSATISPPLYASSLPTMPVQRSPSYTSPGSPEVLEAHVATLQKQLAEEKAESERLRALLDQTQSELMKLKLNATHWPPLNQHNKRARSHSTLSGSEWNQMPSSHFL